MKKITLSILGTLVFLYIGACAYMYFMQESLIFHPDKLSINERIRFNLNDEEVVIVTNDNHKLSGILCKTSDSKRKGLVFFLHGNAGNLYDQQQPAKFYTDLGYDFFTFDYRSFGKSEGEIISEEQFFDDVAVAFNTMEKKYSKDSIIVFGYSVGTGSAAMISSKVNPAKLVLIAPYYSIVDMTQREYPIIPTFLLKYKFETNEFLKKMKCPVLLFHGDKDKVLPYDGSVSLSKLLHKTDKFVSIKGQGHDDFEFNPIFIKEIKSFLN